LLPFDSLQYHFCSLGIRYLSWIYFFFRLLTVGVMSFIS
jgi:hypothetical protein